MFFLRLVLSFQEVSRDDLLLEVLKTHVFQGPEGTSPCMTQPFCRPGSYLLLERVNKVIRRRACDILIY